MLSALIYNSIHPHIGKLPFVVYEYGKYVNLVKTTWVCWAYVYTYSKMQWIKSFV